MRLLELTAPGLLPGDFGEGSETCDLALDRTLSGMTLRLGISVALTAILWREGTAATHCLLGGEGRAVACTVFPSFLCSDVTVVGRLSVLAHHSHGVALPNSAGVCELVYGQQNMEAAP